MSSCNDLVDKFTSKEKESVEGGAERLEAREVELRSEKEKLEERLEDLEEAIEDDSELVEKEVEVLSKLDEVRDYAQKVESTHAAFQQALMEWREATRNSFEGVQLEKIRTVDGKEFTEVKITKVTDSRLSFEHSSGSETLEITRLPIGLRRNVIHEPTVLAEQ